MQVYIELAIAENFCMDFCLLFGAKVISKNSAPIYRLILGSILGAAFAVVFPLIPLAAWASAIIKVASGIAICLVSFKGRVKGFMKFVLSFFILTAILGGALIGVFSLTGWELIEGGGFILASVPIGIPLFAVLLLIILAKYIGKRLKRGGKNRVRCHIYVGQLHFCSAAFFDSGNSVYLKGEPVSVISKYLILEKLDELCITGGVKIHTVSGSKILDVFTADRVEVELGDKTTVYKNVKIGISNERMGEVVLHPDLLEE